MAHGLECAAHNMFFSMHADPVSWPNLAPGSLPEGGALNRVLKSTWAQLRDTSTERPSVAFSAAHCPPLMTTDWTAVTQASENVAMGYQAPWVVLVKF